MKTKQIREVVFIAHRYIGLAVGILAAAIGLTGSLLIIHGWTSSLLAEQVIPVGERLSITALISIAQTLFPNFTLESLTIPKASTEPITAWWAVEGEEPIMALLNPYRTNLRSLRSCKPLNHQPNKTKIKLSSRIC